MEQIVTTLISSGLILLGTVITVLSSNNKIKREIALRQDYQQEQIDEMKRDIKEHNNYAKMMPSMQTEINYIKEMIEEVKK